MLTLCAAMACQLDQVTVATVAGLDREGVFTERGYKSPVQALSDLLGWEGRESRRRVVAAEQVTPRAGLDGSVLPPRLSATAEVFAQGRAGLRHVEVIARVLGGKSAGRLSARAVGGCRGPAGRQGRAVHPDGAAGLGHGAGRTARPGRRGSPTTGHRP